MRARNEIIKNDEMRPEYDLRGGVRGEYFNQYMERANFVRLDSDVAAVSRDSKSVNDVVRVLKKAAKQAHQPDTASRKLT